ncbi:MAG: cytochrome b N-terminal domain-containing protein [Planctomycetes bacterium]|nr:cytochrome b N-terminal domain-containing protein [Planctomycetota bacterium]
MSGPGMETTSQIHDELLAEVKKELELRGTSQIIRKPEPGQDSIVSLAVTAIFACLAILAGSGAMMALVYTPTMEDANASTAWFQAGALGAVVRASHYHAANLLIVLSGAYLGYLLWRGLFRRPAQWRWWRAIALIGLVLAFGMTGQTLPFDQLAVHGTNIRLGYLAEAPVLGEHLRALAQGGDTIGTATLARFFGLHAIVLPALLVVLARFMWRDSKAELPPSSLIGTATALLAIVVVVAVLWHAPLGLQGNLDERFPEARPEWYALPLYTLLKFAPPGALHLLILFVAPLLGAAVVFALPFIETVSTSPARLRKPLQIGLIATVALGLIFSAVTVIQDMSDHEGWFRKPDVEELMTAMGSRNRALMNSAEALPAESHNLARDIQLLHERLKGNYPDPIDDAGRAKWDELAAKGAAAARKLLLAPDGPSQVAARNELREICEECHKAHDKEEIKLDPPPMVAAAPDAGPKATPPKFFFDAEKMKGLTPVVDEKKGTGRQMDQMKYRLRDILRDSGIIDDPREADKKRTPEQSLVDLKAIAEFVGRMYEDNAGSFYKKEKWDGWIADVLKRTDELAKATDPADVGKKAAAVGKACEACHDGADDLDEPIEWAFQSLLAGSD